MARPVLLDDLRERKILNAIGAGLSRTVAAQKAGLSKRTLMEYLARGRDGEEPFAQLLHRVQEAEAKAEEAMVGCIRSAALDPKYWQAAAWWLERCRPADYAKREATRDEEADRAESDGSDLDIARSVVAALESRKAG